MNGDFVTFELAEKLREKGFMEKCIAYYWKKINEHTPSFLVEDNISEDGLSILDLLSNHNQAEQSPFIDAPTISQVLKWLRKVKNIDIEIRTEVGMLGDKVYVPFISTYTEFTLETSPDVVRYRQKKFNPTSPLPHEIIPALTYFKEWEEAALAAIEYVINNLI